MINIPNLLSGLRLVLAPFIVYGIATGRNALALVLFAIAAITDLLDGMIARRFNLATVFGERLDPIADKALMSSIILALGFSGAAPWWFVTIVLGRDVLILIAVGIFLVFAQAQRFRPSVWGKASTLFQIVVVALLMCAKAFRWTGLSSFVAAAIVASAALTAWSGIHYAWRGVAMIKKR